MDLLDGNTPLKGSIAITDAHNLLAVGGIGILAEVLKELQGCRINAAGIGLAIAVVEKHQAQLRAKQASQMLRKAAKAGADLAAVNVTTIVTEDGELFLSWDVADMEAA